MRRRFQTVLLVIAIATTVVFRSGAPAAAHGVVGETCSQTRAEGHAPCVAPPHEGRVLLDIVSRANAAELLMALPVVILAPPLGAPVQAPLAVLRSSLTTARRHVPPKRFRLEPDANDPA